MVEAADCDDDGVPVTLEGDSGTLGTLNCDGVGAGKAGLACGIGLTEIGVGEALRSGVGPGVATVCLIVGDSCVAGDG